MLRPRDSQELFEIMKARKEAQEKEAATESEQIEELEEQPVEQSQKAPTPPPQSTRTPVARRRSGFVNFDESEVNISLPYDLFIVVVVAAVGVLAGMYFLGRYAASEVEPDHSLRFGSREVPNESVPPVDMTGTRSSAGQSANVEYFYSVQVISYGKGQEEQARKVADFLKQQGIRDVDLRKVSGGRGGYVLYAGVFPRAKTSESKALQRRLKDIRYGGRADFGGCREMKRIK